MKSRALFFFFFSLLWSFPLFAQKTVLTIVSDQETQPFAQKFEASLRKFLPNLIIKDLSYAKAQSAKEKFHFDKLPFGFFSANLKEDDRLFFTLAFNRLIIPSQDTYIINPDIFRQWGQKIIGRRKVAGRLDIFSMGFCPACRQAEYLLAKYLKEQAPDFNLHIRFVGWLDKEGNISSLHGAEEVDEDIAEKTIERHFRSRLLDFLIKKKDAHSYKEIIKALGISQKDLDKYYQESLKLVKADIKFSSSLGINSTPTFLWQNNLLLSNFSSLQKLIQAYLKNRPHGKSTGK